MGSVTTVRRVSTGTWCRFGGRLWRHRLTWTTLSLVRVAVTQMADVAENLGSVAGKTAVDQVEAGVFRHQEGLAPLQSGYLVDAGANLHGVTAAGLFLQSDVSALASSLANQAYLSDLHPPVNSFGHIVNRQRN